MESPEYYELRGIAKNEKGDFAGGIGDYTLALDRSREEDIPRLLRHRGWAYAASQAYQPAIEDFDRVLSLAPRDADAYLGRGLARARLNLDSKAESDANAGAQVRRWQARFTLRVARVFTQAMVAVLAEARGKRPDVERLVKRYEDRAVTLVRLALQRTPESERGAFFHNTILADPAMKPIRKRLTMSLERDVFDRPRHP